MKRNLLDISINSSIRQSVEVSWGREAIAFILEKKNRPLISGLHSEISGQPDQKQDECRDQLL